jgi:pyruvate formate lyase activating enzyme
MVLGGIQKTSLIDYPESVSCVVFTMGCNMACGYCHNPELSKPVQPIRTGFTEEMFFEFLESRKGKLEAVVITGGEPTIHDDLPDFIKKIKEMGFKVKLDTQGTRPEMVEKLLNEKLLDYVAMDIKAPIERYREVTVSMVNTDDILRSIKIIMNNAPGYEFRTTIVKDQLDENDMEKIGEMIKGAPFFALQKFVVYGRTLDPSFMQKEGYDGQKMLELKKIMEKYVNKCIIR